MSAAYVRHADCSVMPESWLRQGGFREWDRTPARVTSSGKDMLPSPRDQAPITVDPSPCDLKILRYFLRTLCLVIVIGSRVENAVKLLAVHYIAPRLETFPFVNSKFL